MKDWAKRTVDEVMSTPIVAVQQGDTLEHILHGFVDHAISGAVVADERGHPVGVLSIFDVMQQLANLERPILHPGSFYDQRLTAADETGQIWEQGVSIRDDDLLHDITAADMMTPEIITVAIGTSLLDVAREMAERHVHRLLVADDRGRLVGIVSALDIVSATCK